jgi:excisionase family DNA binding protein
MPKIPKNLLVTVEPKVSRYGGSKKQLEENNQTGTHKLVGSDGSEVNISNGVYQILRDILPALELGRTTVTISPANREMTTQEAADILNVSRPYLIKLLEQNDIPHTKTGSHRRIKLRDLMDYKEKRDAQRSQSLNEIREMMEENGSFD